MPEPVFSATTERLYTRLPELYRAADEPLDWPLKRYVALVVDQAGDVEELLDRIDRRLPDEGGEPGDVSELVDPATANAGWLIWLGQLVGLDVATLTTTERRNLIATPEAGWAAGSTAALLAAARAALTGTRTVVLTRHVDGNPWLVRFRTYSAETPDPDRVRAIVEEHRPAGVIFDVVIAAPSWDETPGTWATQPAGLTWDGTLDTIPGLEAYAQPDEPFAGY